jgi:hypothetical protein
MNNTQWSASFTSSLYSRLPFECQPIHLPLPLSFVVVCLQSRSSQFDSRQEIPIFMFSVSQTTLGPTKPPIQQEPGPLSPGDGGVKQTPYLHLELRLLMMELYLHSPHIHSWHSALLYNNAARIRLPFKGPFCCNGPRSRVLMESVRFFHLPNPSSRTMALGVTQPLTEISVRR